MIKTILVPIDGSVHANKALDLASDLAEKYKARIVLLHVLLRHNSTDEVLALCEELSAPDSVVKNIQEFVNSTYAAVAASPYGVPVFLPIPEESLKKIGKLITEKARDVLKKRNLKNYDIKIVDANPADCIIAAAEQEKADMIVMGSRGLSRLSGLFLGSVSHKVNNLSKCTCVTVK